jgi:hypothetical protein
MYIDAPAIILSRFKVMNAQLDSLAVTRDQLSTFVKFAYYQLQSSTECNVSVTFVGVNVDGTTQSKRHRFTSTVPLLMEIKATKERIRVAKDHLSRIPSFLCNKS